MHFCKCIGAYAKCVISTTVIIIIVTIITSSGDDTCLQQLPFLVTRWVHESFQFWHSQPLHRIKWPWLVNLHVLAMHEPNVPSSSISDKDVVKNGGGRWGVLGGWWWQVGEMQGLNILKLFYFAQRTEIKFVWCRHTFFSNLLSNIFSLKFLILSG